MPDEATPFIWQAPNSNAVLFPGERWVELHGFVTKVLEARRTLPHVPRLLSQKLVSKKYPSWLEHVLRLTQARGYWTLYPSPATASAIASVHGELYTPPEEYEGEVPKGKGSDDTEVILVSNSFLNTLPRRSRRSPFQDIPLLSWDGTVTDVQSINKAANEYVTDFRRHVGQCGVAAVDELAADPSAEDLFCTEDDTASSGNAA